MKVMTIYLSTLVLLFVGFMAIQYKYNSDMNAATSRAKLAELSACIAKVNEGSYSPSGKLYAISDCEDGK